MKLPSQATFAITTFCTDLYVHKILTCMNLNRPLKSSETVGENRELITTRLEAKLDFFLVIELAWVFYSSTRMKPFSEYGPDFKAKIFLSPASLGILCQGYLLVF